MNTSPGNMSEAYDIASAVEAKDLYTYGHSKKVSTYAVALAEKIGLSPDEVSLLSAAALLHDIGKVGISDKVLNKKGRLNKEDWEAIKAHPKLGANIIGNLPKKEWEAIKAHARLGANITGDVPELAVVADSILHHHERWDGSGTQRG